MMRYMVVALVPFCFLLPAGPSEGATFENTKNLTTDLFNGYSSDLRPFSDSATPLTVYLGLWLTSVQELNEIDQSLTFGAVIYAEWTDNRLAWDSTAYNGTTFFTYPQYRIWVPDITIVNSVETMDELGYNRNSLYVNENGTVVWLPGGVYKSSCDIEVTYYPFDTQTCKITFSTLTSTLEEINIDADPTYSVHLDRYSPSGTWDLVNVQTTHVLDSSTRAKISFEMKLKRLTSYYVVSIIIPVIFLSFTATLVFALPADSGEKMGTAITVLLAFAVYLTIVTDQMPKTSLHVPVLSLYLGTLLAQTALGVVLSVWILNLHFREEQNRPGPSKRTRTMAIFMQRLMRKRPWRDQVTPIDPNETKEIPEKEQGLPTTLSPTSLELSLKIRSPTTAFSPDSSSSVDDMTWKEIAFTFDRFLFYALTLFLVVSSVIYLTVLVAGGATNS